MISSRVLTAAYLMTQGNSEALSLAIQKLDEAEMKSLIQYNKDGSFLPQA